MPTAQIGTAPPKPRFRIKMTLMLIIFLSVISFITSYKGLVILNTETDADLNFLQNAFVAFIVFTIQATLVVTLLFTIHGYRKITRVLSFLVYLVAMLFSVFFSYGWWYEIFRADSYAEEVYKGSIEQIREDAKTYQAAFVNVREMANELSQYSAQKAQEEKLSGGTCEKDSLPGRGALNYLRDDESRIFNKMAVNIGDLEKQVNKNILELNRLLTNFSFSADEVKKRELQLNDLVSAIGRYRTGPIISQIKADLANRQGDKRRSLTSRHPKSQERTVVACLDAEITDKIQALFIAVDQLPQPKKITLFDQSNRRTVLQRAWQVFSTLLSIGDNTNMDERVAALKLTTTDFIPVVAGLLIDLFILLLGFIDGLEYGRFYTGRQFSMEDAYYLSAFNSKAHTEDDQLTLLQPYLYSGWWHHYLVIPVAQDTVNERERYLHRMVAWLEAHKKLSHFAHGVKLTHLPMTMQTFFQADSHSFQARTIHRYDLYRMRKGVWRELVISHARASSFSSQEMNT